MVLSDKNIVLGVTGGIAAYKACDISSRLVQLGANVQVVMTQSATEIVTPLPFEALTGNNVAVDMHPTSSMAHIDIPEFADILVVAPATANILGKVASGIADDLLTTVIMACKTTVVFAPAMNTRMWESDIVQHNISKLRTMGFLFIPPQSGRLACGDIGMGKLMRVDTIVECVVQLLQADKTQYVVDSVVASLEKTTESKGNSNSSVVCGGQGQRMLPVESGSKNNIAESDDEYCQRVDAVEQRKECYTSDDTVQMTMLPQDLVGKTVLVTAGGTIQHIDPVRYIGNHSSGRMGVEIARAVCMRGGRAILVHGNTSVQLPSNSHNIHVTTTQDMHRAVSEIADEVDIFVLAGAPSDYAPRRVYSSKIKAQSFIMYLSKTEDIAKDIGQNKKSHQRLVIFCAETDNFIVNARYKLHAKHADLAVVNDITQEGAGFGSDTNIVSFVTKDDVRPQERMSKADLAHKIIERIGTM